MTDPSDFPDPSGGNRPPRPPRPPRRPRPPGGGGGPDFQMPKMPNMPKLPRKLLGFIGGLVVLLVISIGAVVSGRAGIVEISDNEVAVIVNYVTGNEEVVNRPGYRIFLPFLEQAFVFDKSPQEFVMSGDRDLGANQVQKLTVRAKDGSNFYFEEVKIQYRLIPSAANLVLHDSGSSDAFKQNWVRTFARSILRDEFGKYSAEEVADQSRYEVATQMARERLNVALRDHGVEIIEIPTPTPKFEERYEKAIADRKDANQEVEKLQGRAEQLIQERQKRLANIERDMATEYEVLLGVLEAEKVSAEKTAVKVQKSAEADRISTAATGQAAEARMLQEAEGLTAQARKEAEGLTAKVAALAARGQVLVREKLAEKFGRIQFEIVPYRRDPAPIRIEHLGATDKGGNN
jgi:regulator of protease activity HflC (stomatin/prohibitin superfamily)